MSKHRPISFMFLIGASALALACGSSETRSFSDASAGQGGEGAGTTSDGGSNAGGSSAGGSGNATGGQGEGGNSCGARDCTSSADNDCSGAPDNTECTGCTRSDDSEGVIGEGEPCFTFPAPASPTGVCQAGMKTCQATADKTALEWGSCVGEVGPTSTTDSCDPNQNGDENCDGQPRQGCPCQPGETIGCGSCGGMQTCGSDFQWGACSVPTPGNLGSSCDAGCGTIQCNGQCSTAGHGGACGSCGGTVLCNGACSVGTPGNLGAPCNQCGSGTIQCNGQCNTTCDVNYSGPVAAVGWGWCAPEKIGDTQSVYCPAGTTPVYCGMGWDAGFWGSEYDDGDGTSHIYNGKGDIDALWNGSGCYVHVRAFNCDATKVHPIIVCNG